MSPIPSRTLRISRVVDEAAGARSLVLETTGGDRDDFAYRPGQYLVLRIPSTTTGSVARCYSLSTSPDHDEHLAVTVKRTAGGYASNWLCDNARVGLEIEALSPLGVFTPANLDGDLALFAGGSGITPVISIAKSALARGRGHVALFYANRDQDAVIFADELRSLAARFPGRLTVLHWLESLQGLPERAQIQAIAAPLAGYEAFICGPRPFMDTVVGALRDVGLPHERIHIEVFNSLSGNPFAAGPSRPAIPSVDEVSVPVEVELDGQVYSADWPLSSTLVDLLLSLGVEDVPYFCQNGECGTCQAILVKGRVRMQRNEVLSAEDLAEGYILTCQATPDPDGTAPIRVEF